MDDQKRDYRETLNLFEPSFSMRANSVIRDPEFQKGWIEKKIYEKVAKKNQGKIKFILHDGPPYANGHLHIGHALNKILKDIIVKYKSMVGFDAPYVPGWDCHGLPIEHAVTKKLGEKRKELTNSQLMELCRNYALEFVDIQRKEFIRMGVRGDWQNPYLTLTPRFEAKQVALFGEMARKGYIYKGLKPVYWCASCETALAEAEVEYADHRSPSIYVAFPFKMENGKFLKTDFKTENLTPVDPNEIGLSGTGTAHRAPADKKIAVIIWTTTPWTLPANQAVALNPDFDYQWIETEKGIFLVARELANATMEAIGVTERKILSEVKGRQVEGLVATHPIYDRSAPIVLGEYVSADAGTGAVHIAPGHGMDDYIVGLRYGLKIMAPVDHQGIFTSEAGPFAGLKYDAGNKAVGQALESAGNLLKLSFMTHSYPHCWRCKNPVIYRATPQWFASVERYRQEALRAIKEVAWYPPEGETRISSMVASRPDWCISRQRVWGVPIPVFYCGKCKEPLLNEVSIEAVRALFEKEGSSAWHQYTSQEILPKGTACPKCGHDDFTKETDIMDVWFDSGSTHAGVLEIRPELQDPADLYLEGSDQNRGWFQSSLLTSVAVKNRAPYRAVLTHGFVVDGDGRKMSKSLGNVIAPEDVIKSYGTDILRLWVASSDYADDVRISETILKQLTEVYRKIRNTIRFLMANTVDFDPAKNSVPYDQLLEIDRYALHRLQEIILEVTLDFDRYQFYRFYQTIQNYCVTDLSSFYFDILKDRLYTFRRDSVERRAAQTVLYEILLTLISILTPVMSHLAEDAWQNLPENHKKLGKGRLEPGMNRPWSIPESPQLLDWPVLTEKYLDADLAKRWKHLLEVRVVVSKALELKRQEKLIGHSLEAKVILELVSPKVSRLINTNLMELSTYFIVSQVEIASASLKEITYEDQDLGLKVLVVKADGQKCSRCWNYSVQVGKDSEYPEICERCLSVLKG